MRTDLPISTRQRGVNRFKLITSAVCIFLLNLVTLAVILSIATGRPGLGIPAALFIGFATIFGIGAYFGTQAFIDVLGRWHDGTDLYIGEKTSTEDAIIFLVMPGLGLFALYAAVLGSIAISISIALS